MLDSAFKRVSMLMSSGIIYLFRKSFFVSPEFFRSTSDNGTYPFVVSQFLSDSRAFKNFKRNILYRKVLEHVSREQGEDYLSILLARDPGLIELAKTQCFADDLVGNPIKYFYPCIETLASPTTLRYLKVASDLQILFGSRFGDVAEIGCGYGGQALVCDRIFEVDSFTLFDIDPVNRLIERYLNSTVLNSCFKASHINEAKKKQYDLVISNYAFSELPKVLQLKYIEKVITSSKKGYLTMNSGKGGSFQVGKLELNELKELLPDFEIFEEAPKTGPFNYIIVWGHIDGTKI